MVMNLNKILINRIVHCVHFDNSPLFDIILLNMHGRVSINARKACARADHPDFVHVLKGN